VFKDEVHSVCSSALQRISDTVMNRRKQVFSADCGVLFRSLFDSASILGKGLFKAMVLDNQKF
jgi:hypothetical protein